MKTESKAQRAERRTEEIMRARYPDEQRMTMVQQLGLTERKNNQPVRTLAEIEESRRQQSILEMQLP